MDDAAYDKTREQMTEWDYPTDATLREVFDYAYRAGAADGEAIDNVSITARLAEVERHTEALAKLAVTTHQDAAYVRKFCDDMREAMNAIANNPMMAAFIPPGLNLGE